jgi:16S rRNA (uracil1498-N3)-methyltransferase
VDRVFVPASAIDGDRALLEGEARRHAGGALRLRAGDRFLATDGAGREFLLETEDAGRHRLCARVVETRTPVPGPGALLTLAISPPKGSRMDTAVEKAVECGVGRVIPIECERSVVRARDDSARARRWQRIARSATVQSGGVTVPEVDRFRSFAAALADLSTAGVVLLAHAAGGAVPVAEALGPGDAAVGVGIFVGPEGGFSPGEVEVAVERGATLVTLGDTRLRTETAGIVAVALAVAALARGGPHHREG